jgi:tetratricopeptide (TPR) repeat protein
MNITKSQRTMLQGLIAALFVGVVLLQSYLDRSDMRRQRAIEPPKAIKGAQYVTTTGAALPFEYTLGALSGFRQVIAGLLWVRSDSFFHSGNYDAILPLIRLITWLDPNWLDPYSTGGWHLMYNFTDTDQRSDRRYLVPGMALLREGIENNPLTYDMYKEAGWNEFDKIKDYRAAADFYERARKADKNYDVTVVGHALAHCYERLGEVDKAIQVWEESIARHKQLMEDPNSTPDIKARNDQGYKNSVSNLRLLKIRNTFRPKDIQPPVDAQFKGRIVRIKPKVLEFSGEWNLVGAKNFDIEKGILVDGPVDGARVTVRLQDAGYKMPEAKEFSFEVDDKLTIMQDMLSVRGGKRLRRGELYISQKVDNSSVPKNAEVVGIYGFGPTEKAGLGVPLDKALAGAATLTPWGQLQAVSVAYPLPYNAKRKQYSPQEVATKFAELRADAAKIAQLTKDGYSVGTKDVQTSGTFKREIDMSKDPKMYGFVADKFDLIMYVDPRQTPDFVKDRIGWRGEGMTDKRYLNTDIDPGVHMLIKKITVSREDILGQGRKVLAEE